MSRRSLVIPALVLALALSACGAPWKTNQGGFITGDGQVDVIAKSDRGEPIQLTGTTLQGTSFDLASTRGKVTVINVWGAWCGQCMEEAADLQAAHEQLGDDVPFLGLDIRETSLDLARSYEKNYGITYPSIHQDGDKELLAFGDLVSPRTIPATIILGPDGVPATIIRGRIPSTLTLVEAVQDVQKHSSGAA